MAKIMILFVCMSLILFGSSQSASFKCKYKTDDWDSTLDNIYRCEVQNSVSITTLDEAQVDSVSGPHQAAHNNDNVEAFSAGQGQIHFFPRGLNKFFKNLKAIYIAGTGLKEIHQSDLKDFPDLISLYFWTNNLEIIEKNLFEFNPNLELIYLGTNKISHIDPDVFDKLTKLNNLMLDSNTCINMRAENNSTAVQNVIKAVKAQCNLELKNMEQKVKNFKIESKDLNSEKFKEKLDELENEIKNSKYSNLFQEDLQNLKAAQTKKAQNESAATRRIIFETCSPMELKVDNIATILKDLKDQTGNGTCSANSDKDNDQCKAFKDDLRNQTEAIGRIGKIEEKIGKIEENLTKIMKALKIED